MILIVIGLLLLPVILWKRRLIYVLYKTLPRDSRGLYRVFRLFLSLFIYSKNNENVNKIFHKLVQKHPNKVAYYFEGQEWTYKKLDDFSNRVAHYFKSQGYKKEDVVALLLENRPEYIGIWLGLSKIGVVTALINTNLVSSPLVHSIRAANNKGIIFGSHFTQAILDIKDEITDVNLYQINIEEDKAIIDRAADLQKELEQQPTTTLEEMFQTNSRDKLMYIYTSGTTGMPKPAVILHDRYLLGAGALYFLVNINPDEDIFYSPLPLYHSTGVMLAANQTLVFGVSVVLRRKFSASNYWIDCQKYNCTAAIYVGEMCRYLLAAHQPGTKIEHKVKKIVGNGLRPQIWQQFKDTFGIEEIYEFYGATEGNCQMVNMDGRVGAVGFIPVYARGLISNILIKCDENSGEPIKNKDGFYIKCKIGEPGLLLGKINQKQSHKAFSGYANKQDTQKKILKDVLVKGDTYFNTGDILVEDEFGYFYFRDRTGDTFRWKGENVATCEVEALISNLVGYNDATVYGVIVPNTEGRAGMAAIVDPNETIDLKHVARGLKSKLPGYAVPIFLRIMKAVPKTGTYKLQKFDLQKEGFDVDQINDSVLYILDNKSKEYVPLTKEIYNDILEGRYRL